MGGPFRPLSILIVDNMDKNPTFIPTDSQEKSEVLANILCEEIIRGQLKPGEKLSEAAIGSRFKVSRGPVREALRRLSERNLVVFVPNVGARVASTSLTDMLHLMEVRESLEVLAAGLAAEKMTTDEKSHLETLYQNHLSMFSKENKQPYFQSPEDLDFHYAIAKGSSNPVLVKILCEDLYPKLLVCRSQHQYIQGRGTKALEEHQLILGAIAEGDSELASIFMKRHLRSARASLENLIEPFI
jgi:DNA-binding GntR family transcriptional regulator